MKNPDGICNRRGRDGDRRIGRGRNQERPCDGAARGVMQGAGREEVFGDPLPEAARLRRSVHGPQRHGQGDEAESNDNRQGSVRSSTKARASGLLFLGDEAAKQGDGVSAVKPIIARHRISSKLTSPARQDAAATA